MRTILLVALIAGAAGCGSIDTAPESFPASVVSVPARTVVAMRVEALSGPEIERFAREVEKQGITPAGDIMVRGADLLVPVAAGTDADAPLAVTDVSAMEAAAVECESPTLEAVDLQVDRLYDWVGENGYRPVAQPIRVLLSRPPGNWRVEILIPVEAVR